MLKMPFFFLMCILAICSPDIQANEAPSSKMEDRLYKNWQELKKRNLDLVPVPKNITFDKNEVVISGDEAKEIVIVISDPTERGKIAANEIISRIKELAPGKEIPVESKAKPRAFNIFIENKWPNFFTEDASRPEETKKTDQSYCIMPCPEGIKLAGNGEMGLLYAAVTTRFLIASKNGKVVLYTASVIDWPDFKNRHVGSLPSAYFYAGNLQKTDYINWLFRMKINGVFRHTIGAVTISNVPGKKTVSEENIRKEKELNDYARLRGIVNVHSATVSIGTYPKDKDKPGFDEAILITWAKRYYCWSRLDIHEIKSKNTAEFCKETGTGMIFVHCLDGGGFVHAEHWNERCKKCQEKYGDDRASADADTFNLYHKALSKYSPDTGMIAVAYPYNCSFFDAKKLASDIAHRSKNADSKEVSTRLQNWVKELNRKLDKEVLIAVRENSRENLLQFYKGYEGRPVWIYWEVFAGIMPLLPTPLRSLKTAYIAEKPCTDRDILWVNDTDYHWFNEGIRVCAAEYSWNTDFPGNAYYDPETKETGMTTIDDQKALDIMSERAAAGIFGGSTTEYTKNIFSKYLSFRLAGKPEAVLPRLMLDADETKNLFIQNQKAAQAASASLAGLWNDIKNKKIQMGRIGYIFFISFLKTVKAAEAYSTLNFFKNEATRYIKNGNLEIAENIIKEGKTSLKKAKGEYDKILEETKDEPVLINYEELNEWHRKCHEEAGLLKPDFAALQKELDTLELKSKEIYSRYNIPEKFMDKFQNREIYAMKTTVPENVQYPDQDEWIKAQPVEYFISDDAVICPVPLSLSFLYDNKNLYIHGSVVSAKEGVISILLKPDSSNTIYRLLLNGEKLSSYKNSAEWDSNAKYELKKQQGRWNFEMAIPLEKLGIDPQKSQASCQITYTNRTQLYKTALPGNSGTDGFSKLSFREGKAAEDKVQIVIKCPEKDSQVKVHSTGVGSLVGFKAKIETERPLLNLSLKGRILDEKGQQVGEIKKTQRNFASAMWLSDRILTQLENIHNKVELELTLTGSTLDGKAVEKKSTFVIKGSQ